MSDHRLISRTGLSTPLAPHSWGEELGRWGGTPRTPRQRGSAPCGIPDNYRVGEEKRNPPSKSSLSPRERVRFSFVMLNSFQHLLSSEIPKQVRNDVGNVRATPYGHPCSKVKETLSASGGFRGFWGCPPNLTSSFPLLSLRGKARGSVHLVELQSHTSDISLLRNPGFPFKRQNQVLNLCK